MPGPIHMVLGLSGNKLYLADLWSASAAEHDAPVLQRAVKRSTQAFDLVQPPRTCKQTTSFADIQRKPKQDLLDDDDDVDDEADFDPAAPRPARPYGQDRDDIPPPGALDKWNGPAMQGSDNIGNDMVLEGSCGAVCFLPLPPSWRSGLREAPLTKSTVPRSRCGA